MMCAASMNAVPATTRTHACAIGSRYRSANPAASTRSNASTVWWSPGIKTVKACARCAGSEIMPLTSPLRDVPVASATATITRPVTATIVARNARDGATAALALGASLIVTTAAAASRVTNDEL